MIESRLVVYCDGEGCDEYFIADLNETIQALQIRVKIMRKWKTKEKDGTLLHLCYWCRDNLDKHA